MNSPFVQLLLNVVTPWTNFVSGESCNGREEQMYLDLYSHLSTRVSSKSGWSLRQMWIETGSIWIGCVVVIGGPET